MKPLNIIKNNKAIIEIYADTVRKKYNLPTRNLEDYKAIQEVWSVFKTPLNYKNWTYTFIEVLDTSKKEGILMKRMPGVPMQEDQQFAKDNYFHAGVWLGYFHNQSSNILKGNTMAVYALYDYTVANIFIGRKEKAITAFDPRSEVLNRKPESRYLDMITFFISAIISHFKRKQEYNKECIREFIKGYNIYSSFKFEEAEYRKITTEKLKQLRNSKFKHQRNGKINFFIGNLLVSLYIKYHLKPTLKKIGK